MRLRFFVACSLLPVAASAQERLGPEFRVNAETALYQTHASVDMTSDGSFVVAWRSYDDPFPWQPTIDYRRFDRLGTPAGSESRMPIGPQQMPDVIPATSVAVAPSGAFAVAWDRAAAQVFDASGAPVGSPITLSTAYPTVARAGDGFVLAWTDSGGGVIARRLGPSGTPLGVDLTMGGPSAAWPVAGGDRLGGFVMAWGADRPTAASIDVLLQRYDAAGAAIGPSVAVNTYTTGYQGRPDVAVDANGTFVIVWLDAGEGRGRIQGQLYDSGGTVIGANFPISSSTTEYKEFPSVAYGSNGTFLVVWEQNSNFFGGTHGKVLGRRFDASGNPMGPEFIVNARTATRWLHPRVAGSGDGRFVVVWHDDWSDGPEAPDVYAQMFLDGNFIFEDGFESGTHAAWSSHGTAAGALAVGSSSMPGGGSFELDAVVSGPGAAYVQDDTPDGEPEYHARFYVDPNGFDPGEGAGHLRTRLFLGFQGAPSRRLMAVVLRRQGGAYSLRGRARRDDNSQADTAFVPITDEPHFVEVAWRRSSGPDANDGWFEMWIDGDSAGRLSGLDNGAGGVDFVRLGALSVKSGASGSLLFDRFDSRREGSIGP